MTTRATGHFPSAVGTRPWTTTLMTRIICCFRSCPGSSDGIAKGRKQCCQNQEEVMRFTRRDVMQAAAATALAGFAGDAAAAETAGAVRVGLLTVKTGP